MTDEFNFEIICNLTTKVLGLPDGALALKSRKRNLQVARSVAAYIGRKEEDIHRVIIGKVLNRNRSLIYHYEKRHKTLYRSCEIYRDTFDKVYKSYIDVDGSKDIFLDADFMKRYLLKNGVSQAAKSDVLLEVKSGQVKCIIKTSYFDFSNQLENVKLALGNYHFTVKII